MNNSKNEPYSISGALGISNWMKKKSNGFEINDFIGSPCESEEGFFNIHYGQNTFASATDQDNSQELGMTIQVRAGDTLITDQSSPDILQGTSTPVITVNSGGLGFEGSRSPNISEVVIESNFGIQQVKPVFRFKICDSSSSDDSSPDICDEATATNLPIEAFNYVEERDPINNIVEQLSFLKQTNFDKTMSKPELARRNTSIAEKVINIPVNPFETPSATPFATPISTPHSSPVLKRKFCDKVSGVIMEHPQQQSGFSKFFFTGANYKELSASQGKIESSISDLSASSESSKHIENHASMELNLKSETKIGQKLRPKPSTLREMNCWAPTSM